MATQVLTNKSIELFTESTIASVERKILSEFDPEKFVTLCNELLEPMRQFYNSVAFLCMEQGYEAIDKRLDTLVERVLFHKGVVHGNPQKDAPKAQAEYESSPIIKALRQKETAKTQNKPVVVKKQPLKPTPRKMVRLIIAGGRDYQLTTEDQLFLESLLPRITCVVSGGARGADAAGERFAKHFGLPLRQFPAQWDKYGKSAGYRRNEQMAEFADAMVVFPGGRGSQHMVDIGTNKGLEHIVAPHHCQASDEVADAELISQG